VKGLSTTPISQKCYQQSGTSWFSNVFTVSQKPRGATNAENVQSQINQSLERHHDVWWSDEERPSKISARATVSVV